MLSETAAPQAAPTSQPAGGKRPVHYVMWRFNPGGAELSVRHYIRCFGPARALYAYGLRAGKNELYDEAAIAVRRGTGSKRKSYLQYFAYCREHRRHIFHLLNTGPLVVLLALLAGVKRPIYHIHGTIHGKTRLERLALRALWRLAALGKVSFIANSRYSAGIFQRHGLPAPVEVIYNGFEVEAFYGKRTQRAALRRMAYAGRLQVGKNVELVIQLFEAAAARQPDLELLIAGDGPLRAALEAQAAASPYGSRIRFLGYVRDIASVYAEADLLVFPSAYESFGNVLVEALLTGLPVLASDIPVFEEIHGGEPAFRLGDPADPAAVQARFLEAIADFSRLAELAFAASSRLKEKFSIEAHIRQIETFYD